MKRARRAGLRTIFEAHNVSTSLALEKQGLPDSLPAAEGRARERHRLEREILSLTDALVCTQRETLDQLKPLLAPETPTIILGNGTRLAPAAPMAGKDIDVLYCGSLKEWKGVDTLVYAMQSLHPWVLTIVGPGTDQDLARLKALALALGVRERVRILPPVSPSEVWGLYGRARVGVIPLPSGASVEARSFTSPLKLFEMLAAGLPIVASRLPSLTEYIENDREALLVDPDDPRFLAFGIRRILTEETLSARLSEAARRRAAAFTWDERGRRLVEFARGLRS
jgi:glycosyltransferase involved in cell wall biosynthesis